MWNILKAEFGYYYKIPLSITVGLNIWLIVLFSIMGEGGDNDVIGVLTVAAVVTAISAFYIFVDRLKTKRERFHAVLPVSLKVIGISRLLCLFSFWLINVLVFCTTLLSFRHIPLIDILPVMFVINGIIMYFTTTYLIARDMGYFLQKPAWNMPIRIDYIPGVLIPFCNFLLLLYFVVLPVPYIGIIPPYYTAIVDYLFGFSGMVTLNLAVIFLSYLEIKVFSLRISYLS